MNSRIETLRKGIFILLRRSWVSDLNDEIYKFLGINHIKISPNLEKIIIYLNLDLIPLSKKQEIFTKLEKLVPFFRWKLINKLSLPVYIQLRFEEDLFIKKAQRIEQLIDYELKK